MKLTVYHLKTCDTCRKAIKALESAGHTLNLIDVRLDSMPHEILATLVREFGWETVLNRRSTTWRGLGETDKENTTNEKAIQLMQAHPTLIKRPVVIGSQTTIGWAKDVQAMWL